MRRTPCRVRLTRDVFMNWQNEHKMKAAQFPEAIRNAHTHSSKHRVEIEGSEVCGCFYCCCIFHPSEIKDWVDENAEGIGQCAYAHTVELTASSVRVLDTPSRLSSWKK